MDVTIPLYVVIAVVVAFLAGCIVTLLVVRWAMEDDPDEPPIHA